jgi:FAD/FMN-containing dehydrogenase
LLWPDSEGYEAARTDGIFNARKPSRYPSAILRATSGDDVVSGVRLAAERGLSISVRAGGHSWAAWSVRDGALMIDLTELDDLSFDSDTGIVVAGPAVRGGLQLAPYLAERGRAFPAGHCPSVGIGGYLLQGGQGWNGRAKGWACESVVAVDVVTADGELLRADADQNQDLYWAARGAGPGFPGIVVRFHLQTYPASAAMWHDTWTFALDDGPDLIAWLHTVLPALDRRVEPVVAATRLTNVPLRDGTPHPGGTLLVLHTTCLADSDGEARDLLAVFATMPMADRSLGHAAGPTSIGAENLAQAAQNPDGHRYAVDCSWSNATAATLAPLLDRVWRSLDTDHSFSIWYGWAPRKALPDMAFSVEGNVYVATYLIYDDESDDERYQSMVHAMTADIARSDGAGVYLGDTDFTRRHDRFLTEQNFARLQEIRRQRDPHGRFESYLCHDAAGLNRHA